MAALSAVKAAIDLYNSIDATAFGGTTRPPIHLDQQPATTSTGAQRRVPYAVLRDNGFAPEFQSNAGGIEKGTLIIELYAEVLDTETAGVVTVDKMTRAVKYGGSAPGAKAGFDWGTLTITGYLRGVSLRRVKEQRAYAGFNFNSQPVFKCTLTYEAVTQIVVT
jgi:hypothetical protein